MQAEALATDPSRHKRLYETQTVAKHKPAS
jgi:hypothetical protein